MIYFDNNATTPLTDGVKQALLSTVEANLGNASSLGSYHDRARALLRDSREKVATLTAVEPEQVLFTSSGSEANVTVIRSAIRSSDRLTIVVSEIEHSATTKLCEQLRSEGYKIETIPVTRDGVIDTSALPELIDEDVAIVSVQSVNNETGVCQPIDQVRSFAKSYGAVFHCDAAQGIGKSEHTALSIGADYVTFAGHKFHAPPGTGVIVSNSDWKGFSSLITGGSQEFGIRGGTHNLLGIVGLGAAAAERTSNLSDAVGYMQELRDRFEAGVIRSLPNATVNGGKASRVCNTSNIMFPGIDGKALFAQLLDQGVMCSQSSACTAQYPEPSRVLRAMGLDFDQAFSSIRFSFSPLNTRGEVDQAVATISESARRIAAVTGGTL